MEVKTAEKVEIAERFMEARNAYDAKTGMSLLADDGATALLMYDCRNSVASRGLTPAARSAGRRP